ncbi:MAG: L-threonylcarbamoyladenylate synthase [bacterium]
MTNKMREKISIWQDVGAGERVAKSLQEDNILITSTDTVLGFLANITERSYNSLNTIKGDRENKPYVVLIESIDRLKRFVDVDGLFDQNMLNLLARCWPGPVTLVFKAKPGLPSFLVSPEGTIALRCPSHAGLRRLLRYFEGLFSTSANLSGKPMPTCVNEIPESIIEQIMYIVLDRDNNCLKTVSSTILDCSDVKKSGIRVVREGAYGVKILEGYYGAQFK